MLDSGTPVENVEVDLYKYNAANDDWDYEYDAETAADGTWSLPSGVTLDDGDYATFYYLYDTTVKYSTDQGWNGTIDDDVQQTQFSISGGSASVGSITENLVRNAGVVKAQIIDAHTGTNVAADNGYVSVSFNRGYSSTLGRIDNFNMGQNPTTNGTLEQDRVLAGTYTEGQAYGYSATNGYFDTTYLTPATVAGGATTDLGDITLYRENDGVSYVDGLMTSDWNMKITGTPKVGTVLTVAEPSTSSPVSFAYQWFTEDHPIIGATSRTFIPTAAELSQSLYVEVVASAPGYISDSNESDDTAPVVVGDANQGTVAIAGTAKYGNTVSAAVSTALAGANAFQWYLNGNPIAGADGSTYAIKATDVGSSLSVSVKSVVQGHTDAVIPSAGVLVTSDTANTGSITITGTAKLGKTIKAAIATALPGVVSYKWFRNGTLVGGVDGSSYTIGKADLGKTVSVTATSAVQGHADAVLVATKVIAKDAASVKATSKGAKVTVTVKPGTTKISATAKVRVYYSSKKYTTITVKSGKSASVTLTKLKQGTHSVKVAYQGNASYAAKTVSIKVKVTK